MVSDPDQQAAPEAPAPPAVVFERFPEQAGALTSYAGWLAGAGTVRGLIGPREVPRLWDRHLLNSAAVAELLPHGVRLVDLGSGAGLPGLPLAIVRPDLRVDLVEPLLRRATFLTEVVADLGLTDRVKIVRGRAEDRSVIELVGGASYLTARAVAPLDKLVRLSFPLLVRGGSLLAMKGNSAEDELARYESALGRARAEIRGVVECGVGLIDPPARVVHLVRR